MSHGTCTSRKLNSLGAQEALVGLLACSLQEDARYSVDYKFLHVLCLHYYLIVPVQGMSSFLFLKPVELTCPQLQLRWDSRIL
eukprot:scaffold252666_cov18-Tisochrysis_lutea.AAC.4